MHKHQAQQKTTEQTQDSKQTSSSQAQNPQQTPLWAQSKPVQRQPLTVNQSNDPHEREAEQVANQVMKAASPTVQRESKENAGGQTAPASVHSAISRSGQSLDNSTQQFMESRFNTDFSGVRVHTDNQAKQSAADINAAAYTVGNHIVFGSGHYQPQSTEGKHLLAHELTHVIQQQHTSQQVQRDDDETTTQRQDVVLIMAPDTTLLTEAKVLAPNGLHLQVSDLKDMKAKLAAFKKPVGRLVIISHSTPQGDLGFSSSSGTTYVRPDQLATELNGVFTAETGPEIIDFRGCSIGTSPPSMETIRAALNAKAAIGGNCFNVTKTQGPIVFDDHNITSREDLTRYKITAEEMQDGMKMLIESFGETKDCILDTSQDAYFNAGGKLVAQWYSPDYGTDWDERKSKCYKDMTPETVDPSKPENANLDPGIAGHCRLIRVEGSKVTTTKPKPKESSEP